MRANGHDYVQELPWLESIRSGRSHLPSIVLGVSEEPEWASKHSHALIMSGCAHVAAQAEVDASTQGIHAQSKYDLGTSSRHGLGQSILQMPPAQRFKMVIIPIKAYLTHAIMDDLDDGLWYRG